MTATSPQIITPADSVWRESIGENFADKLQNDAPKMLFAVGQIAHFRQEKTAFFCSAKTPGDKILPAHDIARKLRDEEKTVIGGFHSPLEKSCLKILLRGKQPIIIIFARAIVLPRIPAECRDAFDAGRILFLSPFAKKPNPNNRTTKETALLRNKIVAAMADNAVIIHASDGGKTATIAEQLRRWNVPIIRT